MRQKVEIPQPPPFVPATHHREWRDLVREMMKKRGNDMPLREAYWHASGWFCPTAVEMVLGNVEDFQLPN